jgi:glycerol-3-phosphate dehydrogenase
MFIKLIQHFGLEVEVAQHLSDNYGDRAWAVAAMSNQTGARWPIYGIRLAMGYPYIEAEVRYACRREYALTAIDVIARRTRLSFLNCRATLEALPRVIEIMASELGWSQERKKQEYAEAHGFLLSMGLSIKEKVQYPVDDSIAVEEDQTRYFARTHFLPSEINTYKEIFEALDYDNDGSISQTDFKRALKTLGLKMSAKEMENVIGEVDLNQTGSVEFGEFLKVLAAVKDIRSRSKFARIVAEYEDRRQVPTDRSGGGV